MGEKFRIIVNRNKGYGGFKTRTGNPALTSFITLLYPGGKSKHIGRIVQRGAYFNAGTVPVNYQYHPPKEEIISEVNKYAREWGARVDPRVYLLLGQYGQALSAVTKAFLPKPRKQTS